MVIAKFKLFKFITKRGGVSMCLVTRVREILRKPTYAFLRIESESGMTLIELMATVLIGGMVTLAVVYLWNAVDHLYRSVSVHASATTDSSFVYWDLEKLAQNTLEIVGTGNSLSPSVFVPVSKNVVISGPVLYLKVSSLKWIAPRNSAVYIATENYAAKNTPFTVCVAFAKNNNGMVVLELYPKDNVNAITPLFSGVTSFSGSTFTVPAGSLATSFSVTLTPSVLSSSHSSILPITYNYGIGVNGY